jgi:Ca2+-binding RTX toxin-like protein
MPITFDFSAFAAGNIFFEEDGIPGNGTGQFRHSAGGFATFSFAYPADLLTLLYKAGQVAYLNPFDSLDPADLTVGNLADPAASPDAINVRRVETNGDDGIVTLVTTGAITEWGDDAAADIVAGRAALSAGTGIGTPGNALETRAGLLDAETDTGGINIRDLGTVRLGQSGPGIEGLSVGTSGDIKLEAQGSIFLSATGTAATIVGGSLSGNVTLNALGPLGDIMCFDDHYAVVASAGSIALNAGRDVALGIGTEFDNDVRANGNITISAGRDVVLDGGADIYSDAFNNNSGGGVTITAGGDIAITDVEGSDASVGASGTGNVTLTAGRQLLVAVAGINTVFTGSGDVIANADYIVIETNSGISAVNGKITLRPHTAGHAVEIGGTQEQTGRLALADAELDRLFAEELLIGGSNAGPVTVVGNISPTFVPDVTIQSGSDITVNAGVVVQSDLTLRAGGDIALIPGSSVQAGGVFTGYVDIGNNDPGIGGTAWVEAGFASAVRFFGGNDSDTLRGGAVDDWLDGAGGADTMRGRLGNDTYAVDNAADLTLEFAGEGADTVRATVSWTLAEYIEVLTQLGSGDLDGTGNGFANTLNGNSGNNTLSGLANVDTLLGNGGNDTLLGGDSNDLLNGGAGNDTMNGGNQVDTVSYAGATAAVTVALVAGAQATGGSGSDTISNVENLTGSSHSDTLTGDGAVNVLTGGNGGDTLNGLGGNDTLLGEVGADTLVGGLGRDLMTGGSSADVFDFNDIAETGITGGTRDQIIDFVKGSDKIDLATIDANSGAGGNQAFAFIGAAAFSGVAGELRAFSNATLTVVYGDVNGDSAADFQIQINAVVALAAGDFML